MTKDLINYRVERLQDGDPWKLGPGDRFEVVLKNMTKEEAAEALILLDRLQRGRSEQVRLHGDHQNHQAQAVLDNGAQER